MKDGLPNETIKAIVQTADGYLWLATNDGLARFDGVSFTVFDKRTIENLTINEFTVLYEDRERTLWCGTISGGLVRYRDGEFRVFTKADGLPGDSIMAVAEDGEGALWLGTHNGLSRFDNDRFTNFTTAEGLPSNIIARLAPQHDGGLLIATDKGTCVWREGKFTVDAALNLDGYRNLFFPYRDREGVTWAWTPENGGAAFRMKDGALTRYTAQDGLTDYAVLDFMQDRAGRSWFTTHQGGLLRFEGDRFSAYTTAEGLSNNTVNCLLEDREGSLWVGTNGGLNRLKDTAFITYAARDGLANDVTWSVTEARDGSILIGTSGGLSRLKNNRIEKYGAKDGLPNAPVVTVMEDRAGDLWAGTSGGGLLRNTGKVWKVYTPRDGLSHTWVRALYEDTDGSLLVSTRGGINRFADERLTVFATTEQLTGGVAKTMVRDRAGALWIGTTSGRAGLHRFKDGEFKHFNTGDGLSNNYVLALHADAESCLWIATNNGLTRLKDDRFTVYNTGTGLPDDNIFGVIEDRGGNLWMSSPRGIFRVAKSDLNDYAEGRRPDVRAVIYTEADGMLTRECSGGTQPAAWLARDGQAWFATTIGVAGVDMTRVAGNHLPPPVHIEQFVVDHRPLDALTKNVRLAPGTHDLELRYAGLSFLDPAKVSFRYKLEGYDRDWLDAGTRRVAYYTNLPAGNYSFKVIACNNDGVWNETGAKFAFEIAPHFYQTTPFYLASACGVLFTGWSLYRLRLRQVERRFAVVLTERNRIAREIHDTLAQGFVGVSLHLESVAETIGSERGEAHKHLDRARALARSSLTEARRSIRNLRAGSLVGGNLATALALALKETTEGARIESDLEVHGTPKPLPAWIENDILRIGQEALTNVVKHAAANRVAVRLAYEPRRVCLGVQDDGRGFDSRARCADRCFGLLGMRERAHSVGGTLTLESRSGEGTTIELSVPLRKFILKRSGEDAPRDVE